MIKLYDRNETDFTHNGIKILKPLEAIVIEELNGDYSLKLAMPRGNKEIEIEQIIKVPTPKSEQLLGYITATLICWEIRFFTPGISFTTY